MTGRELPTTYWVLLVDDIVYFVTEDELPGVMRQPTARGKPAKLDPGTTLWLRDVGGSPVCVVLGALTSWFLSTPENRQRDEEFSESKKKPVWE